MQLGIDQLVQFQGPDAPGDRGLIAVPALLQLSGREERRQARPDAQS